MSNKQHRPQRPEMVKIGQRIDLYLRRAAGRWRRRVKRGESGPLVCKPGQSVSDAFNNMKPGDTLYIMPHLRSTTFVKRGDIGPPITGKGKK